LLYIFNPNETLIALLKPDFTRSAGPAETSRAFLSASFPAEFDREPTEGCPYWDPVHREVLNSENVFQFVVPANQADAAYVQEGNLVAFKDLDAYWQLFEIKRLVDTHGDGLTRTAYCEHILYELLDDIVVDKRPESGAAAALIGMLENTRWQVGIVDDLGTSKTSAYYESVLSAVQNVANAWHGELNWRCIVTGGVITRYVDLLAMRGTDTGKQFAYTKDILSIEREVDISAIATALYGRGKGIETESGGYGRRLTFADVEAVDKPLGQEWIGDDTALAQWGRPGGRHRFDVFIDEEETDAEALLEKTRAELAKRIIPRTTYRLSVASLEELTGYEHEAVRLGDLVRVIDREFRPELVVSARVVEIERDLLNPANTKVVLGSFAPSIVDATINTARRVDDLANRPYNTKWLDGVIDVLQNAIENSQAYIWETPQGTLHLNAPTYAEATEAMLLGGGRFAIANQKDGLGGWNWRTFGDGAGFTADAIRSGTLDCSQITVTNLDAGSITTGTLSGDRITGGTIDGVNITGSIITAANTLTIGADGTEHNPQIDFAVPYLSGFDESYNTNIWLGIFDYGIGASSERDSLNIEVKSPLNDYAPGHSRARMVIKGKGYGDYCDVFVKGNFMVQGSSGKIIEIDDYGNLDLTGAKLATNGNSLEVLIGGAVKFKVNTDGTKVGGTIELDNRNWGMSPVDSPKILISDLMLNRAITPEGTLIMLDEKFSRSINGYAILPSKDVVITKKLPGSFIASGNGIVDFYLIGKRVGHEQDNWTDLGEV
jgi:phage minor structural protein